MPRSSDWKWTRLYTNPPDVPRSKPTWAEMEARIAGFPEKDREHVRAWFEHRRHSELLAPGSMRLYLQRLHRAAIELPAPLLEANRSGDLEALVKGWSRGLKDPWTPLCAWRLFLAFHREPHAWAIPPRRNRKTRASRRLRTGARTFNIVSDAEFKAALARAPSPMLRCALYMLWDTGMRPSELLSLRYSDIERDAQGHFYAALPEDEDEAAYPLKTGPRKVVLVESVASLREWLNHHPTKKGPLFPGERGPVMARRFLLDFIKEAVPGHTCKDFRHTAATRATLAGWNEATMRAYFGWEPASSMPSYYAEFTASDANRHKLKRAGLVADDEGSASVLPVRCSRCNTENVRENVYCYACGGPLQAHLIAEVVKMREATEKDAAATQDAEERILVRLRSEMLAELDAKRRDLEAREAALARPAARARRAAR